MNIQSHIHTHKALVRTKDSKGETERKNSERMNSVFLNESEIKKCLSIVQYCLVLFCVF